MKLLTSSYIYKRKIRISSRANVMIEVVPIVVFQLFSCKGYPGDFVRVMIRRVKAVTIMNIERWIWMPKIEEKKNI